MTALTISEYFRDQNHKNVLLLMDNVFRFVQAGAEVSSHMDCVIVLSRAQAAEGFYAAIDPLVSTSTLLDPLIVGQTHADTAEAVRQALARFGALSDIISLLGVEELGTADRLTVTRARRLQRFLTQPFRVSEAFTGAKGVSVPLSDTLAGCRAILDGEADTWAESSLYMIGSLAEARAKEAARI